MLDRDVRSSLDRYGMGYPYEMVKDILADNDVTFGNLECPLTYRGTPVKSHGILFRADTENASFLKNAGYDILNLSNNHMMDFGHIGLHDTLKALDDNGIEYVGLSNIPIIFNIQGIKVGFLGYSEFVQNIDEDMLKMDIPKAKSLCDFLVVSFHSGIEYNPYPTEDQKKWSRHAIDYGADLIIGHHPHVLQGMEKYRGKLILYSLGNFIFDRQIQDSTDESIILKVKIDNSGVKVIETIPVIIRDCRPELAKGEKKEQLLQRFKLLSSGISPP